ncbi:MAG TPA: TonB-dependent receptor [Bacteroidia bacterium]|nr:TonB-dependent receptor [Bacteroidia bacterium]
MKGFIISDIINKRAIKKWAALLLLIHFQVVALKAQQPQTNANGKITGRIVDSATGQAVEYASISLALQADGKEINGMTTDDKGVFVLTNVADGTYEVMIFFIGYKDGIRKNIIIDKTNSKINLGDIKLSSSTGKLADVTISADKRTVEYKIDKTVYNVDKDITSQTGVATDALKKIPDVSVDVDGNVELQGNANIRFLINGKPSTIFGNNLVDVLQSIPASQIQSIEVITSPGAKYDAEGTGGIINIILKKSTAQGINGNVSLSGGTRLENGSFNLNARKGKFGAHAFFSGNAMLTSVTPSSTNRTGQDSASTISQLDQNGSSNFRREGYQTGAGFDWDITPKDNFSGGFSYNYFGNNNIGAANRATITEDAFGNPVSDVNDLINTASNFHAQFIDWNAEYKKTFAKEGQELDLAVNSSTGTGNTYYMQTQTHLLNDSVFNSSYGNNPGLDKETDFSIDYTQPLDSSIILEMGAKAAISEIVSTSDVYLLDPIADSYSYNTTQSSSLDYKDNVYAAYFSGTFKLFKWLDVKAGVRYEYTQINANFSTSGNVDIQPYGTLVPSAVISHTFKNNQSLKIAYSRRIERPDFMDLNPFVNASDPKNITTGNPALQPEIGDKVELGYNKTLEKGGNIYLSLFYRDNTHDIQPYTIYYPTYKVGDSTYTNVSVTTRENIGREENYGFSIFGQIPIQHKINLRSNVSLFYRTIYTGLSTGGNISGFNYRINLNGTYEFGKTYTFEAFGNFNSARLNAQGTYPAFFSYNFAIRKLIFHKNGSIALTATNPFDKYIYQTTTLTGDNFTSVSTRELPYQSFGFNFTYKFGKLEFKKEKEPEDSNLSSPEGN